MKGFNKILSLFLCIIMLFSLSVPMFVYGEETSGDTSSLSAEESTSDDESSSSSTSEPESSSTTEPSTEPTTKPTTKPTTTTTTKKKYDPKKQANTTVTAYKNYYTAFRSDKLAIPITITPAYYGRTVNLQRYDIKTKKFVTVKSFKSASAKSAKVSIEIPSQYRDKTYSTWRFVVEENERGKTYTSGKIKVATKNVETLSLNSQAACIICVETGEILYAKNPYKTLYPASSTKLMTALVTLDTGNLNKKIRISSDMADKLAEVAPPTLEMRKGDSYKKIDLIYAMILPSCNDAAYLLAASVFGSQKKCVNAMNKKAKKIGLKHTHFSNTYGYPKNTHYTCAYDMCLMAIEAGKYPTYVKVCKTYKYKFTTSKGRKYTLKNGDKLNGYKGHIGGKTGFYEKKNKASFTGLYKYNGKTYAVCQMYASKKGIRWTDMKKLYEYCRKHGYEW